MSKDYMETPQSILQRKFQYYVGLSIILMFVFLYIGSRIGVRNGISIGVETGWNQHSIELAKACKTGKKFILTNGEKGWYRCSKVSQRRNK